MLVRRISETRSSLSSLSKFASRLYDGYASWRTNPETIVLTARARGVLQVYVDNQQLTQLEVCQKLAKYGAPMTQATLSRYLSGKRCPSVSQLVALLDVLEVSDPDRLRLLRSLSFHN
jgi:hypothetical protein